MKVNVARRSETVRPRGKPTSAEEAQIVGNAYCLLHYATGYAAGTPRRLSFPGKQCWIMPVVLTSPGYGIVGEVGFLAVEARSGKVIGSTPRSEVVAAGNRLTEEKRDGLEAAFHRARAT